MEIREKIASAEYDFLRNDEHLGKNIILLTCGGSHAYGTNVEGSDLDIRGIAIERPQEIIGLKNFEQFENRQTDTVVYALRKVLTLLSNCNPNVVEMLGTNKDQLYVCTKEGEALRENMDLFLSQKAKHSFGGYASQQLRRLQNALARDSYPQSEKEVHMLKSIENQMRTFEDRYKPLDENLKLYIGDSEKEDYDKEILVDFKLEGYPLRDFKNMYSEMSNVVKDYGKLNHRNKKKDELHLNKHAMHLIRLLIMGAEILEGKGVKTCRPEREFLLDIRHGKYSYEQIFEMVDEYEKKFKYAADNSCLPEKPNYNKIEEMLMDMYMDKLYPGM